MIDSFLELVDKDTISTVYVLGGQLLAYIDSG